MDETERKLNCWEFMKCDRGPGGTRIPELGICPAATHAPSDGLNHGEKAGRICWIIAGTMCDGKPSGSFVTKIATCMNCPFYRLVVKEEGRGIVIRSKRSD